MVRWVSPQTELDISPSRNFRFVFSVFKRPRLFSAVNSAKIVDTFVLWTGSLTTGEIWYQHSGSNYCDDRNERDDPEYLSNRE